jgi:replication-associated recombination protein RarA
MADRQKPLWRFGDQLSRGGYRMDEVTSALQKAVRRGAEADALWWATELDLSGYGAHAWSRLVTICSEDVGLAWPEGPAVIHALHETWLAQKKAAGKDARPGVGMLQLVHAVAALSRAPKSRIVDNACNLYYGHRDTLEFEVPDYALDSHTRRGREMGRTERSTYESSYGLANQTLIDPYVGPAHPWMSDEQVARHAEPHEAHPTAE